MGVRITTWNVNGIRNPFAYHPWCDNKTFDNMFNALEADIVIFQELKIQRKDLRDDMVMIPDWDVFYSLPKHKKGYSGVGIFTRQSVCCSIRAEEGLLGVLAPPSSSVAYRDLPADQHIGGYLTPSQLADVNVGPAFLDSEGRCLILEFPAFVLFGIYSPANSSGTRDDFRHGFLVALDMRVRNLINEGKRVVVCGDLNVSREEFDTANAQDTLRKEAITHQQYLSSPNRRIFNQMLEGGLVYEGRDDGRESPVMWDVCRGFHPNRKGMFTHWEQKINARPGNFGSRIDFVLSSLDMKTWFTGSDIQEGLMGSDHCPVYAELNDIVTEEGITRYLLDILNPPGTYEMGRRVRYPIEREIPSLSAKLMPDFEKRRNIKDMFFPRTSSQHGNTSSRSRNEIDEIPEDVTAQSPIGNKHNSASVRTDMNSSSPQVDGYLETSPMRNSITPSKRKKTEDASSRPAKKTAALALSKSNQASNTQKSLLGFFVPREPLNQPSDVCSSNAKVAMKDYRSMPGGTNTGSSADAGTRGDEESISDELAIDAETAKVSWSRLLAKPIAPLCEHEEPCKIMKTRKAGFNCGREFWMCQRPLGPSGEKQRNSQWRCPTFIWSSDWKT